MIVRRNRLARANFSVLLRSGKRLTTQHFYILYSYSIKGYAVVVSKKVSKTSVGRHKLKRRIQSILNNITPSSGYVIFARNGANTLSFLEIKKELDTLLIHIIT